MTRLATEEKLRILKDQFAALTENDRLLILSSTDELQASHDYFLDDMYQECQDQYLEVVEQFQEHLLSLSPPPPPSSPGHPSDSSSHPQVRVRLPQLDIPKFDGMFLQWESFHDRFCSLIANNADLSGAIKLQNLQSALCGSVASTINHLTISDANFAIAWDLIQDRFDNLRLITDNHVDFLISLPSVIPDNPVDLRRIHDQINTTIQALAKYGCKLDVLSSLMLTRLVVSRLSKPTHTGWAQLISTSKEITQYDRMREFLLARISVLEEDKSFRHQPTVRGIKQSVKALSTQVKAEVCVCCHEAHALWQCPKFVYLPAPQRLALVTRHHHCHLSLASHKGDSCKVTWTCRKYQGRHHRLLHNALSDNASEAKKEDISVNSTMVLRHSPIAVVLPSARVKIHSSDLRSVSVRALLDQCAEATLITENLAQLLRLKCIRQSTRVSGIGPTAVHSRFKAVIGISPIPDSSPSIETEAIILPHVMRIAPRQRCHLTLPPQIRQLKLPLALRNLAHLERRLATDPRAQAYAAFMVEYAALHHMQPVPAQAPSVVPRPFYIPHHSVIRSPATSDTGLKLRVVFNASAHSTTGVSLNSLMLAGPKLQTKLASIILRWRRHRFVLSADIVKMYRQIWVHPDDVDYQRIMWRESLAQTVSDYQLLTVTYGTTCAPFLALRALRQLEEDEGADFPDAQTVLSTDTYVDDCLFGADTFLRVAETRGQLTSLLRRGGFELSKWASNHPSLPPATDVDSQTAKTKELKAIEEQKILGILWNSTSDSFSFRIQDTSGQCTTKRQVFSVVARIFDPLGWITPATISSKILLQQLWRSAVEWDEPLPLEFLQRWTTHYSQLGP